MLKDQQEDAQCQNKMVEVNKKREEVKKMTVQATKTEFTLGCSRILSDIRHPNLNPSTRLC